MVSFGAGRCGLDPKEDPLFILVVLSIVYGTAEDSKSLAVSSSISAASGFKTDEACKAAGERLLASPRPSNLEIRYSCEAAE